MRTVLRLFRHTRRIEDNKIGEKVHEGKFLGSSAWGRTRKEWIHSVKSLGRGLCKENGA